MANALTLFLPIVIFAPISCLLSPWHSETHFGTMFWGWIFLISPPPLSNKILIHPKMFRGSLGFEFESWQFLFPNFGNFLIPITLRSRVSKMLLGAKKKFNQTNTSHFLDYIRTLLLLLLLLPPQEAWKWRHENLMVIEISSQEGH